MMKADPLERTLERKLFVAVRTLGGMAIKIIPALAGPPDRLVLLNGRTFLVELKREDGKVSNIQNHWHLKSREIGVPVYVLYGLEGVRSWLRAVVDLDGPRPGRPPACACVRTLDRLEWRGLPDEHPSDLCG